MLFSLSKSHIYLLYVFRISSKSDFDSKRINLSFWRLSFISKSVTFSSSCNYYSSISTLWDSFKKEISSIRARIWLSFFSIVCEVSCSIRKVRVFKFSNYLAGTIGSKACCCIRIGGCIVTGFESENRSLTEDCRFSGDVISTRFWTMFSGERYSLETIPRISDPAGWWFRTPRDSCLFLDVSPVFYSGYFNLFQAWSRIRFCRSWRCWLYIGEPCLILSSSRSYFKLWLILSSSYFC